MKIRVLILLVCFCFLVGCSKEAAPVVLETEGAVGTTEAATVGTTVEATVEAVTETTVETTPESVRVPYLVKIERFDFPIYEAAGYGNRIASYLGDSGTFTIVEEVTDAEGNLWGKLKSGAGWVDLTLLEKDNARGPLLEIVPPADMQANIKEDHLCILSDDDFTRQIILKANATLTDVQIFPLVLEEKLTEQEPAYTLPLWNAGAYMRIDAAFPGDMSTYGIRVTDEDGVVYRYNIWENLSGEGPDFTLSTYAP